MKNKELDLLIVVNMFLTGFDATTLNTLWVDKNLKWHGLIQAFSRTNRILNSVKRFGNIVCFRNLQKRVDEAIARFGDSESTSTVLMKTFDDYYYGYQDVRGVKKEGYVDLIDELKTAFPLDKPQIVGEERQKAFIMLFGTVLRMRNLLVSFDEFAGKEILTEREFQDYLSRYQDLYEEYKRQQKDHDKESINNDLVFEMELVRQIEINIDYILMMVIKYKESHCTDKEIVVSIMKAVDAGAELRSKKELIATFIENINDIDDVMEGWNDYVQQEKEKDLTAMISENNLKPEETRKFIAGAFRDGEIKTSGTEIDQLMPPMRRFGNTNRASVKQVIIDKLMVFFNKYRGIV